MSYAHVSSQSIKVCIFVVENECETHTSQWYEVSWTATANSV